MEYKIISYKLISKMAILLEESILIKMKNLLNLHKRVLYYF